MSIFCDQYPPFRVGGEMIPPYLLVLRDLLPPGPMTFYEVPPTPKTEYLPPGPSKTFLCTDLAPPGGVITFGGIEYLRSDALKEGDAPLSTNAVVPPSGDAPSRFRDVVPPSADFEPVVPLSGYMRFEGSVPHPSGDGPLRLDVMAPPSGDIHFSPAH